MTINRAGLGVRNVGPIGSTPRESRLFAAATLAENSPGVPRSGLLDPSTPSIVTGTGSMAYSIAPCNPVINRTANEGVYMPAFTGTTGVQTTAAPGSGARYDLIYVKQNDTEKGDPDNLAVVGVVQGVSGAAPARPTQGVPDGALVIAEALVQAGATATSGALVSIDNVFPYTATRGTIITVRGTAERNLITPFEGLSVRRLDQNVVETYRSGAWRSPLPVNITSLKTGWSKTILTGDARPRVWSTDGITAHLTGALQFKGGGVQMCDLPAGYAPESSANPFVFLGTVHCSNGNGGPGGPILELWIENGTIRIGYQSGSIPSDTRVPLHGTYPLKG
ncbi:hypothetical protein [Arthrobacter zhaoguopingii]|uniref:hypothetical protein n=1 Tax=Arthrobacter zhaoguopingii TaxID=2681491 RepID=UPI00135AE12A|nr:hypothetical protein [Arthrobacter zhaoguopingii]